ncbi:MAG TPA: hypothetical protein VM124_01705 [Candidatus Limnocylindrales bacterium]|nr:hypothetical protein [Candidatus Limnocylindrales bacterium]
MATPKRYIHDRLVLLLLTANTFFAILTSVLILLKLDSARTEAYIIQYRPSLGLSRYFRGNSLGILSFAVFSLLVLVFHTILSARVYPVRRHLAITILAMGLLLIILSLIISYSLLLLR